MSGKKGVHNDVRPDEICIHTWIILHGYVCICEYRDGGTAGSDIDRTQGRSVSRSGTSNMRRLCKVTSRGDSAQHPTDIHKHTYIILLMIIAVLTPHIRNALSNQIIIIIYPVSEPYKRYANICE